MHRRTEFILINFSFNLILIAKKADIFVIDEKEFLLLA